MYVEVSIPITLFKTFTYIVPSQYKKHIFLGQSVLVSLNKKKTNGFVSQIKYTNDYKGKLLNIISINDNSFFISSELWKTVTWISKYYICPLGKVLKNTISYQHKREYTIPLIKYAKLTQGGRRAIANIKYKATAGCVAISKKDFLKILPHIKINTKIKII